MEHFNMPHLSHNTQRPCYDAITLFDFCGTMGRAWIRTMHTRCSYACLPLSYRPPSIVCLQGLCRVRQYLSSHMAATAKHHHLQGFEYFGHCWKCHGKPTKHTIRQAIVSCLYLYSLLFFDDYYSEAFLWQLALCSSVICKYATNGANQIRTGECRSQSPVPYRLAIAHYQPAKPVFCDKRKLSSNKVDTGIRTLGLQSHNLAR